MLHYLLLQLFIFTEMVTYCGTGVEAKRQPEKVAPISGPASQSAPSLAGCRCQLRKVNKILPGEHSKVSLEYFGYLA